MLPLVKKYGAAVIAISNDETGISEDPDVRYAVAKKIVERAADYGIKREDVVVDPLVMPVGAINDAGAQLMHLFRRLHGELKVNTSCGASNFSFGLPNRRGLAATFLPMMIGAGLTSAIMNPLHAEDIQAILGADVVMGHDPNCGPGSANIASRRRRARRARAAAGARGAGAPEFERLPIERASRRLHAVRASAASSPTARACSPPRATLGVDLDSVCGGRGICGRCQIEVAEGDFAKHAIRSSADHVTPWGEVEQRYADKRGRLPRPAARLPGQDLRRSRHRRAAGKPGPPPGRAQARRDASDRDRSRRAPALRRGRRAGHARSGERSSAACSRRSASNGASPRRTPISPRSPACRRRCARGEWKVTAAVRKGRDIVAVMPGFAERAYGVAIDIGSTTIAAHLCDLVSGEVVASCGAMNPQIRFGEDLMSRVSYVMMNPGGDKELTRTVREAMDALIGEAAREAGVARGEILEVTFVGNPIMHHLVLGLDPTELGGAPFALTIDGGL